MSFGFNDNAAVAQENPEQAMLEELKKIRDEISKVVKDVDRIREVVEQIRSDVHKS